MDIVDFSRLCVSKPLDDISDWMTRIHATVDELLAKEGGGPALMQTDE